MTTEQSDTQQRVREVMVNTLGLDEGELVPEAKLREDLDIDSLSAVEFAMALEMEFEIDDIPMEDLGKPGITLQDVYDYMEKMVNAESATVQT